MHRAEHALARPAYFPPATPLHRLIPVSPCIHRCAELSRSTVTDLPRITDPSAHGQLDPANFTLSPPCSRDAPSLWRADMLTIRYNLFVFWIRDFGARLSGFGCYHLCAFSRADAARLEADR